MGKVILAHPLPGPAPRAHNPVGRDPIPQARALEIEEGVMIASLVASGSLLTLLGLAPAVPPESASAAPPPFVVRISLDLVQVDAVVTDKKGRLVSDLRLEDFEIVEDGRKQPLTNMSYVAVGDYGGVALPPSRHDGSKPEAEPRARVRRTIAILVDDMRHSFVSTVQAREALRRFVEKSLQPGDQASIVFTSSGLPLATPYTSDKALLLAKVDDFIWGRGWLGHELSPNDPVARLSDPLMQGPPYASLGARDAERKDGARRPFGSFASGETRSDRLGRLEYESQARVFTAGTLGIVNDVIDDLRARPGRKSLVLFSDGLPLWDRDDTKLFVDGLRRLVDQANRASVVLYTMDVRGLQTGGLTAQDGLRMGEDPSNLAGLRNARRDAIENDQDPLRYLASETGGVFMGTNDLDESLSRMLADQAGFYLLGYVPSAETFKPGGEGPQFHKVKVKVKRPGLQVRSRKSFYGVADVEPVPPPAVIPRGAAAVAGLP